jgi:hypothetical protein
MCCRLEPVAVLQRRRAASSLALDVPMVVDVVPKMSLLETILIRWV